MHMNGSMVYDLDISLSFLKISRSHIRRKQAGKSCKGICYYVKTRHTFGKKLRQKHKVARLMFGTTFLIQFFYHPLTKKK